MTADTEWEFLPFELLLIDRQAQIDRWLHLVTYALSEMQALPELAKALRRPAEAIADAEEKALIAAAEADRGFPLLFGQAAIVAWGALETAVKDFLVRWLTVYPTLRSADRLGKIRIRLAEYEALEPDDRIRYLLTELERDVAAALKPGVGRFESLLGGIGLGGPVDEDVRRDLLEFSATRNVLVHRAGVADRRFLEYCPWLGKSTGEDVSVTAADYGRFRRAMNLYAATIIQRAKAQASGLGPALRPDPVAEFPSSRPNPAVQRMPGRPVVNVEVPVQPGTAEREHR